MDETIGTTPTCTYTPMDNDNQITLLYTLFEWTNQIAELQVHYFTYEPTRPTYKPTKLSCKVKALYTNKYLGYWPQVTKRKYINTLDIVYFGSCVCL